MPVVISVGHLLVLSLRSAITFTLFILLFLWSTNLNASGTYLEIRSLVVFDSAMIAELFPRVMATIVLLVGVVYLVLAVHTLRS